MNITFGRLSLLLSALLGLIFSPGSALVSPAVSAASISRTTSATPLPASLAWGWPLAGKPVVTRAFDPPVQSWLSGHRGVDLAAPQGAAVLAPTSGVVAFSGVVVNRAVLTIAVDNGLRLSFEPVLSPLKAGDTVVRGQQIGTVKGPTHCDGSPTPSCLHWGVRDGDDYLNPLQFILDLRPSVLLSLVD